MDRRLFFLLSCLLGACATRATDIDPRAAREDARIIGKAIDHRKEQARADAPNVRPALVGIMGPSGLMLGDSLLSRTTIPVYRYAVMGRSGAVAEALSEYPAFELGDCVLLLTSGMPGYPRIARGGDCTGMQGSAGPAPEKN